MKDFNNSFLEFNNSKNGLFIFYPKITFLGDNRVIHLELFIIELFLIFFPELFCRKVSMSTALEMHIKGTVNAVERCVKERNLMLLVSVVVYGRATNESIFFSAFYFITGGRDIYLYGGLYFFFSHRTLHTLSCAWAPS